MARMRRWKGVAASVAVLAAALATAAPAAALQPGVFIDPNSPAGKEYSFPLSVLRSQAAGKPPAVEGVPQPLFGVGITPAGAVGVRRGAAGARGGGSSRHRHRAVAGVSGGKIGGSGGAGPGVAGGGTGSEASLQLQSALMRLAHPGSSIPAVALITAIVLAGGLLAGAGLIRLRKWE